MHSGADVLAWDHLAARDSLHPVRLTDGARSAELPVPEPGRRFDTPVRVTDRYGTVLFVEKEGFLPLFRKVQLAER